MNSKIALVTGGSRGLGRDMALSFAKKGVDIIITYNKNKDEADKVIEEVKQLNCKAIALHLDMNLISQLGSFLDSVKTALQETWQVNTFDYLVNNAGFGATIPMSEMTEEIFDQFMNVHFKGVYFLTQQALPIMNDNGSVIFISSGTTRFCVNGYSLYSSLKSGVETLAKYVAKEYGHRGIRSNVVAPGATETDFNQAAIRNNPQMKTFLTNQTPLGRVGQADDIGSVVSFLCSEEAKWINGQRIEVSGGINL